MKRQILRQKRILMERRVVGVGEVGEEEIEIEIDVGGKNVMLLWK